MKKAFTLIELLVVVLIIGILSAIALPQYQKAVTKARFAEAMTNLKTIYEADKVCKLENGNAGFCTLNELSVSVGVPDATDARFASTDNFSYAASDSPAGYPQATFLKEDVCLCLKEGEWQLMVDQGCSGTSTTFDYNKLLNIPEENNDCMCC